MVVLKLVSEVGGGESNREILTVPVCVMPSLVRWIWICAPGARGAARRGARRVDTCSGACLCVGAQFVFVVFVI